MDGASLALFLAAAFAGGFTSGLSGFAMGLVVSGVWLHLIAPDQSALLIALCGLFTQGSGIWRVRHAVDWRAMVPFIAGGAVGVAAGTALLATIDQTIVRVGVGILLLLYSSYSLAHPALTVQPGGAATNLGVGVANGVIGGMTGFGGVAITVWGQLAGGSKDGQRAIFQPVAFATLLMTAISLAFLGSYSVEIMKLYAFALPVVMAGFGCGIWLYGKLDDTAFRRVVLVLLFAAGLSLVVPAVLR
jgi:uncharacterized protein